MRWAFLGGRSSTRSSSKFSTCSFAAERGPRKTGPKLCDLWLESRKSRKRRKKKRKKSAKEAKVPQLRRNPMQNIGASRRRRLLPLPRLRRQNPPPRKRVVFRPEPRSGQRRRPSTNAPPAPLRRGRFAEKRRPPARDRVVSDRPRRMTVTRDRPAGLSSSSVPAAESWQ